MSMALSEVSVKSVGTRMRLKLAMLIRSRQAPCQARETSFREGLKACWPAIPPARTEPMRPGENALCVIRVRGDASGHPSPGAFRGPSSGRFEQGGRLARRRRLGGGCERLDEPQAGGIRPRPFAGPQRSTSHDGSERPGEDRVGRGGALREIGSLDCGHAPRGRSPPPIPCDDRPRPSHARRVAIWRGRQRAGDRRRASCASRVPVPRRSRRTRDARGHAEPASVRVPLRPG